MRIIIDTDAQKIICPKSFWADVEKKNTILKEAGQPVVSHKDEVRKFFEQAMDHELARPTDVKKK